MNLKERGTIVSSLSGSRQLYRYAVDLFIYILSQVQKRKRAYRCNDADKVAWDRWYEYYTNQKVTIGQDFIRKYIEYGIQSWFNDDTTYFQRQNCRFSWIFGAPAIKRWNALNAEARQHYVTSHLKQRYKIKKKISSKLDSILLKVRPEEERIKNRYLNTPRGLLWCKSNTNLFFHRSPTCMKCIYREECKRNLGMNMPKLYRLRGYGR